MSRFELMKLLFADTKENPPYVGIPGGGCGILVAVEREDGSGHCFNVTVLVSTGNRKTFFVRTID